MTTDDGARRGAIYCRISRDRVGAGLGIERQEADCRELAKRLGWTVEAVHCDNDISAYSGKPRPGYLALLEDIRAGRVDGVLVWHTDRLHRSPVELESYIRACEPGKGRSVETQTVKAGVLDLATPTGRMVARTLGNIAHFEVEHMIERQKSAKKQIRQDGRWQGGPRPYGYRSDGDKGLVIVEEEAAIIRIAASRILAGEGLKTVAKDINARGARTPDDAARGGGRGWHHSTLRRVLCRASNAALIEEPCRTCAGGCIHERAIVGPGKWDPILDEAAWRGVRAILTDPARRTTPGPAPRWLLTGAMRCDVCGGTDFRVSRAGTPRRPSYQCRGGCVGRDAERLNEWVEWLIFERLSRPGAAAAFKRPDVDMAELEGRRTGLRARLDALGAAYGAGQIDVQQMATASRPMLLALKNAEDAIGAAFQSSALDGMTGLADPAAVWAGLSIARQRSIVQALLEVVILPTRGRPMPAGWRPGMPRVIDPDALEVRWKTP